MSNPPIDAEHAFAIGAVAGALMARSVETEIIDDEHGAHLDTFRIKLGRRTYLVRITPEPQAATVEFDALAAAEDG